MGMGHVAWSEELGLVALQPGCPCRATFAGDNQISSTPAFVVNHVS